MRVPAALHRWAAEHNRHLSAETRAEVDVIASRIDASPLGSRSILEIDEPFRASLRELFLAERAERADMLVQVVAEWAAALPAETPRTTVAEVRPRPATVRSGPPGEAELGVVTYPSGSCDEGCSGGTGSGCTTGGSAPWLLALVLPLLRRRSNS